MATPKITTTLFNFRTFRSPDRIDEIAKMDYLIQHPDFSLSVFNECPPPPTVLEGVDEDFVTFFEGLEPAKSYKQIVETYPGMYSISSFLLQYIKHEKITSNYVRLFSTISYFEEHPLTFENIIEYFSIQLAENEIEFDIIAVWDELFILTVTQKSIAARQACVQMIIAHYYLENHSRIDTSSLQKLSVLIPQEVIQCFKRSRYTNCEGEMFGVQNLGIEEYRRVEQTLCCYVPGEVSHIENVMAREYKEKSTRNLLRTEYSTEFSSETEIENLSDTSSTERNELNKEVAKELQKDRSLDISGSVTVNQNWTAGNMTANASTGFNSSNSSSLSDREAQTYAKEITERALERVVQKVSEKRTYKMIKEFEENNKHGFDNREGDKHVTGVYRWVDKIYDNQLINYGRKLLLEINVPSPAAFYKKAMEWKKKADNEIPLLVPPLPLSEFGITDWESLNSTNVQTAASNYGILIKNYQEESQFVSVSFGKDTNHSYNKKTDQQENIIIPQGFIAHSILGNGSFRYRALSKPVAFLELNFNGEKLLRGDKEGDTTTDTFPINLTFVNPIQGAIAFSVTYRKVFRYSGAFSVHCVSDPELFIEWQQDTFFELQNAYQKKLDEYNEELRLQQLAQETENVDESENNPSLNRLIEQRELKRLCVEMMSKPYCHNLGLNFIKCQTHQCNSDCGEIENQVTIVDQNQELEKYAEFVKFFETAFHWEIFSYTFFPYYYNAKCQWSELLQTKHDDPIFQAFLQSGMAKVLVPVRPQFERAVMWYLETGEIYLGENITPDTEDDRYASLLKELDMPKLIKVEDSWQTRIPSSLTLIQAKSTYLEDQNGLPCCDGEDPDAEPVRLIGSEDIWLQRLNENGGSPAPNNDNEPEEGE